MSESQFKKEPKKERRKDRRQKNEVPTVVGNVKEERVMKKGCLDMASLPRNPNRRGLIFLLTSKRDTGEKGKHKHNSKKERIQTEAQTVQ